MSNRHNYSAKERRMVINAIAGTAYTILNVMKRCRSMDWKTQYGTCIEALCESADALVGDSGGREEVISRLADDMNPVANVPISNVPISSSLIKSSKDTAPGSPSRN